MGYHDSLNKIKNIEKACLAYQEEINNFQNKLSEYASSIDNLSVGLEDIESQTLIAYSQNSINKINKSISSASSKAASALSTLEADANKKIKEIVDAYNASRKEDDPMPRLSYKTISLSGSSVDTSSNITPPCGNKAGNNTNNAEINKMLEKIIVENDLSDQVASVTYKNNRIYCELKNGETFDFSSTNINSQEELIKKIKSFL